METVNYLRAFRRRWIVIVAAVLVGLAAGVVATTLTSSAQPAAVSNTTVYDATAIVVPDPNDPSAVDNVGALQTFATWPQVAVLVAADLKYKGDPANLSDAITAATDTTTNSGLMTIDATDPKAVQAIRLANLFATDLVKFLKSTKPPLIVVGKNSNAIGVKVVGPTIVPAKTALPSSTGGFQPPKSRLTKLLIAVGIGLLAGLALALVLERFDTRIRTKHAAEKAFGLPVLAEIPFISWRKRRGVPIESAARPFASPADAFRLLGAGATRPALQNTSEDGTSKSSQIILVTSPGQGDGKTTVVANLSATFAEVGKKVLVFSCDFRRPRVHQLFGVENSGGLADALSARGGEPVLNGHTLTTSVRDVLLVPSGSSTHSANELLSSAAMREALAEARERADVVLIDTAPILLAGDATHLFPEVDAVLIVARAGKTTAELAARTSELVKRLGGRIAGVVLNGATELPRRPRGYGQPPKVAAAGKASGTGEDRSDAALV